MRLQVGSKAAPNVKLPGPPQQTELAYLAALVDRSGTFCASANSSTVAIKVTAPPALRLWLMVRFGGIDGPRSWQLSRQADLRYVATGIAPYLVVKRGAGTAFLDLLAHLATRESYHGTADWRAERDRLKGEVRSRLSRPPSAARAARPRAATPQAPR